MATMAIYIQMIMVVQQFLLIVLEIIKMLSEMLLIVKYFYEIMANIWKCQDNY